LIKRSFSNGLKATEATSVLLLFKNWSTMPSVEIGSNRLLFMKKFSSSSSSILLFWSGTFVWFVTAFYVYLIMFFYNL
jgi:hypothetical protein